MINSFKHSALSFWRQYFSSSEELDTLLDLIPRAALVLDARLGNFIRANAKASELTAYTRGELIELSPQALFPTLDIKNGKQLSTYLKDNREIDLSMRGGNRIKVHISLYSLDSSKNAYVITFEPLIQRKQREAERERQDKLWDALQDLSKASHQNDLKTAFTLALDAGKSLIEADYIAIYQGEGGSPQLKRFTAGDSSAMEIFPSEIPSSDLGHLSKPLTWRPGKRPHADIQRAARVANMSYITTVPLGHPNAWVGLLVAGSKDKEPLPYIESALQIIGSTLTTKLQHFILTSNLEKTLQHSNQDLLTGVEIQDAVNDGIVIVNPELEVTNLNVAAEMMLGYAGREVIGEHVENVIIGAENLSTALKSALQGIATHNLGSITLHRRSGEAFLAHVRTIPVILDDNVDRMIIMISDLSEQEAYQVRTQQLEQRALLGEVMAIFAHEVRNPINNISTGLQLMQMGSAKDESNSESIDRMLQDCTRLTHLMESVLSFSRATKFNMEIVDLGVLVERLLQRWRPRMARFQIEHLLQIDPDTPKVQADPRAFDQVFTNLISNAVRAMREDGGILAVKIGPANDQNTPNTVEISISDTGPGIPDEILGRIFEPFFTTYKEEGTGLGLAITKRIITAHKGSIAVDSIPGGTVFTIQLPGMASIMSSDEILDENEA